MDDIWYCTREQVERALDAVEVRRTADRIDDVIRSSSRIIDGTRPGGGLLHRRLYPELRTMTWDWPASPRQGTPWRLWLDADELLEIVTMTSGGVVIPEPNTLLRPDNGPPYSSVELDRSSSSVFAAGDTTQRAISIYGLYGYSDDAAPAGALESAVVSASATTIDVTNSAAVGVGSLIRVGDERMTVTGKSLLDSGQNIGATLAAANNVVTVPVTDGTLYAEGETILVDAERMEITDIAGNNLIVKRNVEGTVLAAHTSGADIYVPRRLTVRRGVLGTTAATHLDAATVTSWVVPGPVNEYCLAESMVALMQGRSGYGRTSGTGDNQKESAGRGLAQLRAQVVTAYARKARHRAV